MKWHHKSEEDRTKDMTRFKEKAAEDLWCSPPGINFAHLCASVNNEKYRLIRMSFFRIFSTNTQSPFCLLIFSPKTILIGTEGDPPQLWSCRAVSTIGCSPQTQLPPSRDPARSKLCCFAYCTHTQLFLYWCWIVNINFGDIEGVKYLFFSLWVFLHF